MVLHFFNCLNVKNKTIIVLDNHGSTFQINNFYSLKILYDIITKNNKVFFIYDSTFKFDDIKKFLEL